MAGGVAPGGRVGDKAGVGCGDADRLADFDSVYGLFELKDGAGALQTAGVNGFD